MAVEFISDIDHYNKVIAKAASVKRSLWIGTADIKDLHVKSGNSTEPFLGLLAKLLQQGVRLDSYTPRNPVKPSGRTSTDIPS